MTLKHLKFTTLCLAMIGGSQTVMAETQTQLLPLFKAAEIPALCDANLDKIELIFFSQNRVNGRD